MPTTVQQLFKVFKIPEINKVRWGEVIHEKRQGIYIVSTSSDPEKHHGITDTICFDEKQIVYWIDKLPYFRIDSMPANKELLKNRLSEFWLSEESILYIGKAPKRKNGNGIGKRIVEYYKTKIGDRSPHSGGQWIKVLNNLNSMYVYYGLCNDPGSMEDDMLDYFIGNVCSTSLSKVQDKWLPLPFANIRHRNKDKNHGMSKQKLQH